MQLEMVKNKNRFSNFGTMLAGKDGKNAFLICIRFNKMSKSSTRFRFTLIFYTVPLNISMLLKSF